tara:strand:+ start:13368 stop:13673 length:306 start_codon:yes stop_codon:yes gene_type:complete
MYKPLPDQVTINSSGIEGLGLFARTDIVALTELGITHIQDDRFQLGWIRTPLGGFINHSETPNCELKQIDDCKYLVVIDNIMQEKELTLKYTTYNVSSSSI